MKRSLGRKLETTPTIQMNLDELRETIVGLAEVARMEGIGSFEGLCDWTKIEGLLGAGTRLIVDGTHPPQVEDILDTTMKSMMQYYEAHCKMIIAGVLAIQGGWNPRLIDHKLSCFYVQMGRTVC